MQLVTVRNMWKNIKLLLEILFAVLVVADCQDLCCKGDGSHLITVPGHDTMTTVNLRTINFTRWLLFGQKDQSQEWIYTNENLANYSSNIISDEELMVLRYFNFKEIQVDTDISFSMKADDSLNPSSMTIVFLSNLTEHYISMQEGRDRTLLTSTHSGMRLLCAGFKSNTCGLNGKPVFGETTPDMFIRNVNFQPRGEGAKAGRNEWSRNEYTWRGTYYIVKAQLPCHRGSCLCSYGDGVHTISSDTTVNLVTLNSSRWLTFGQESNKDWTYKDEHTLSYTSYILSDKEQQVLQMFNLTDIHIDTDITFSLQADDSFNPSSVTVLRVSDLSTLEISMLDGRDRSILKGTQFGKRILCYGSEISNTCGKNGKPDFNEETEDIIYLQVNFQPQGNGSSAKENQWERNKFTWMGSYYRVLARLPCQRETTKMTTSKQRCRAGTFGFGCRGTCHCGNNSLCDQMDGVCADGLCEKGWHGYACQSNAGGSQGTSVGVIVGIVIGALAIFSCIAVVVFCVLKPKQDNTTNKIPNRQEPTNTDDNEGYTEVNETRLTTQAAQQNQKDTLYENVDLVDPTMPQANSMSTNEGYTSLIT